MDGRNVPNSFQELIFSIPSNESLEISANEFVTRIGVYHRPFQEWLISKCGEHQLSPKEQEDFTRLYLEFIAVINDPERSARFNDSPDGRYYKLLSERNSVHRTCEAASLELEKARTFKEWREGLQ